MSPRGYLLLSALIATQVEHAQAQDPIRPALTMGLGDVAALKQKALSGDPAAQVALGDTLASKFHATEALEWYRKAAAQGSADAAYHVGDILLFGAPGIPQDLAVQPDQAQGIRWTFIAATNHHAYACWNMGKALRNGFGTSTNLIAAYAWLSLFATTPPGFIVGRNQMNEIALLLDSVSLQQAQNLAAQFKAGSLRPPVALIIPDGDPRLKLNGITLGGKVPLAVISGKTLAEGESAQLPFKPRPLSLKCLKIQSNSVLISVVGEDTPRLLRLK